MIGKTISTFDNVLPVEDTDRLMAVLNECRKRPDPADRVDLSPIVGMLVSLQNQIADLQRRMAETLAAPLPDTLPNSAQPERPAEPIVDELTEWNTEYLSKPTSHTDQWRETYQSQL